MQTLKNPIKFNKFEINPKKFQQKIFRAQLNSIGRRINLTTRQPFMGAVN